MAKSVFLYVTGDYYSAMKFSERFSPQTVYEKMIAAGVTEKTIDNDDDIYIEIEIKEFGEIDEEFIKFMKNNLCDEDQLKSTDIFEVNK